MKQRKVSMWIILGAVAAVAVAGTGLVRGLGPKVTVAAARAGLRQARARLRQLEHITRPIAREAHRQADANLELARLSYERLSVLAKQGSAPPAQLDEAKRALEVAQSQHDAAETQARGSGLHGVEHSLGGGRLRPGRRLAGAGRSAG